MQNDEQSFLDNVLRVRYNKRRKDKENTSMKNTILIIVTIICVITICALSIAAVKKAEPISNSYYALTAQVVEVDRDNDIVTCEDSNSNLWEFYGCEDWQEGDCASLLMDTCGTENIYDDEICGTTYGTWDLSK